MVTIRIRSWRPAMPSISGPRATVASNSTVTPFVSGAACSLLIALSSPYFRGLRRFSRSFSQGWSVAAVASVAVGVDRGDRVQRSPDGRDELLVGPRFGAPQLRLDLREGFLDRVEIRGV